MYKCPNCNNHFNLKAFFLLFISNENKIVCPNCTTSFKESSKSNKINRFIVLLPCLFTPLIIDLLKKII